MKATARNIKLAKIVKSLEKELSRLERLKKTIVYKVDIELLKEVASGFDLTDVADIKADYIEEAIDNIKTAIENIQLGYDD